MCGKHWAPGTLQVYKFENPPMLVDPIIPWGGSFLLHGPRASGKTQIALSLAAAVANGTTWLGRWDTRQAKVLFIETDTLAQTLQERLQAAIAHLNGGPVAFHTFDGPINIAVVTFSQLQESLDFEPQLVFIDVLRQTHVLDENDSNTPTLVYRRWRDFFPKSTLGYIHHDRKLPVGPFAADADEAFRGSGAWLDAVDTGMHVVRDKRGDGHKAMLTFSKVRTCEQPAPLAFKLHPETYWPEPTEPTPRLKLMAYLETHPDARNYREAMSWLRGQGVAKTTAHRIARELELP